MSLIYNGLDVGHYTFSGSWEEFYDDGRGSGGGSFIQNQGTHTAYIFLAEREDSEDSYGLGAHFYDEDNDNAQIKTTWVDLQENITEDGDVFVTGQAISTGSHGTHDYAFSSGTPVRDEGDSGLVFESGTGLSLRNIETLLEDDPESFGSGFTDDTYNTNRDDAVAQHFYEQNAGDGVIWDIDSGSYDTTIIASDITDGRPTSPPNPDVWYIIGPQGAVDAGSTDSSITVTIDL